MILGRTETVGIRIVWQVGACRFYPRVARAVCQWGQSSNKHFGPVLA